MASISSPLPPPHRLSFSSTPKLHAKRPFYPPKTLNLSFLSPSLSSRISDSLICRYGDSPSASSDNPPNQWRWDAALQDVVRSAMKRFHSYKNSGGKQAGDGSSAERGSGEEDNVDGDDEEWDWDRWRRHFDDVDEQERLVSILKSQLSKAVPREDYEDAARLKVAIAAAAMNDTVGRVMSKLERALAEECYQDAALLRDNAGAGLVGWWSGISEDVHDPYGLIIRITAEYGRYVAWSYSPRQLATAASGTPLFEIFLTMNKKGKYKRQAVYLKRKGLFQDPSTVSTKSSGATSRFNLQATTEGKGDPFVVGTEDCDDGDDMDSDITEGLHGFQNILSDMIPGMKVKVLKVTAPARMDKEFILKVIEHIMDEEDEENNVELKSTEVEDVKGSSDKEGDGIEMDAGHGIIDNQEQSEIAIKVVVGGLSQKLLGNVAAKDSVRVPAKFVNKGRKSFSLSVENDVNPLNSGAKEPRDRKAKLLGQPSMDPVMFDLAKVIGREKIPLKVLKEVGELMNLTLNQARNRRPLSGSTTFNRIEISASPDPLNGLYIGASGLYISEVIHLQHKFGQWQEDNVKKESNLEFYEYVEAVKLSGDPYVPAGQVLFRAKVGKRDQLPHKGIIPEEFGVIARYKGQGRLAIPGLQNPEWVDGELVIFDGKYIKGGPVIGFVCWAPEHHFLVFFNRLRLQ